MKKYTAVLAVVCIFLQVCLLTLAQKSAPPVLSSNVKPNIPLRTNNDQSALVESQIKIAEGTESFALELWKHMSDAHLEDPKKSYMISPFAVWSLLLLLAEGAGGNTLTEFRNTLHLSNDQQALRMAYKQIAQKLKVNTNTIEVASFQALFTDINKPVNRDYESLVTRVYESALIPVHFSEVNSTFAQINADINRATRGLLPHSVTPQDFKDAALLMISALYFKGKWKYPFKSDQTITAPFHDEQEHVLGNVQMMTQIGPFNYISMKSLESYILELPYGKEDRLSMLIVLPRKSVSLNKVVGNLRTVGVKPLIQELEKMAAINENDDIQDQVEVFLPRFSTTSHFTLRPILTKMGIVDAFEPDLANFDNMAKNIYVGKIFQSTRIIVNEEGTEAAAVTTAVLVNKASPTKFYLDRPFAYMIVEKKSGLLLFAGEVRSHEFS
ncbi:serine protease inhibitor 77Ba [Stomoxys calcitrans]|uniref:Serpin domain-containing protein n=1 Tax=Stomoxys calcitrans TaxID=35570 RepID=A0A1I8P159_STOCA|nr:serine protease inhibitor 77Ba [Stomoxys calcitrans]